MQHATAYHGRMNYFQIIAIGLLTACSTPPETRATKQTQSNDNPPNVIVVLLDDLGYSDLGFMGSEIKTPNIDQLAAGGVALSEFYVEARCSPTRASLMTGLSPHEAGLGFLATPEDMNAPPGAYQGFMNSDDPTLAESLKSQGYATYMAGKWHLGEAQKHWPRKRGFDRYFGLISGASSYYELITAQKMVRKMALDDAPYVPPADNFYMTEAISEQANQMVAEHLQRDPEQPFLLYLAYSAPHWPLHAPQSAIDAYRKTYIEGTQTTINARMSALAARGINLPASASRVNTSVPTGYMATYAAMVDIADKGVGNLTTLLERHGALENTLILVFSDNGASPEDVTSRGLHSPENQVGERGSYLSYGAGWATVSNTPLAGHKGTTYEGGIKSPLVAHWPAQLAARESIEHNVIAGVHDLFPTILSAAGASNPCRAAVCGENLLPLLQGTAKQSSKTLYREHAGWRSVRHNQYKALFDPSQRTWALFDLSADPGERLDISAEHAQLITKLGGEWDTWAQAVGVDNQALGELVQKYRAKVSTPRPSSERP